MRKGGSIGGNKDADKPDTIVTLHLADNNSNNKYSDDNDEMVKSFEYF